NVIKSMDSETENFYDANITWDDMENYFKELRLYYGRNVPNDAGTTRSDDLVVNVTESNK
ncbi:hypothetical protein EXM32_19090, partial [Clostridium botulinum]|nr:hypothetical protein [Clostridium botulinum]